MSEYRDDILEILERQFKGDPAVQPGKMMGHPGFRTTVNGKFFMFCYEDGITLKMPPDRYDTVLTRENVTPFQPMDGRKPMSTWVVWVCAEPQEYLEEWNEMVTPAFHYTASEPANPRKKRAK